MKKVLITGAHGDIGSQLLLFLNTRNISTIEPARDRKYDLFDITNLHKLIHQATDTIHLAAVLNNLSAPKIERAKMLCVNSLLTAIIAKLIHREKEKKRFIYMSSEMVYQVEDNVVNDWIHTAVTKFDNFLAKNLQDQNIYKTNFDKICLKFCLSFLKRNPASARINFYSLTKLLAEKFVLQLDNSVILRLTNIYGPGYKKDRKIPRLIKAKLFGNCIHEKNDLRDYVYVSDLNQIIRKLLENNNYSIKGIFDFASRNRILTAEVVKIINKYLPIQYGEIVLEKSKHLALQKRAIKNIFDVLQIVPFDFTAGIQETITFFQATTDYRKKVSCYLPIKEIIGSDEKMIKVFRGGSCSYTLLITDANKRKFVRKVALREGVEGNGLSKLRKEIHYLKHIEEHEPELYRHYSTMRSHKLNEHFVSYDMDYIGTGTNLYRALKNDLSIDIFFLYFEKFISAIIKNGYLKKIEKINSVEAQEIFRSIIVNRALGRSENLFNYYAFRENEETLNKEDKLFQKIIDKLQKKRIVINGQIYQNPKAILKKIGANSDFISLFSPGAKSMCVHGDLTLLNMVWDNKKKTIRLIDPRGLIGTLHPMYDFGKIKFSLSGFSGIMEGNYEIALEKSSNFVFKFNYNEKTGNKLERIDSRFIKFLTTLDIFNRLVADEPNWERKIQLYEVMHYFADIPFRLYTDGNPRNAIACYLKGTILLNNCYNDLTKR